MKNSALVMMLGEALERKGVNAQIPQNQQFQAAENRIDKPDFDTWAIQNF